MGETVIHTDTTETWRHPFEMENYWYSFSLLFN